MSTLKYTCQGKAVQPPPNTPQIQGLLYTCYGEIIPATIGTIATALGSVGAMLTASPAPPATNFTTFAAAAGPILTGITSALAPELLLVPTKTTEAT